MARPHNSHLAARFPGMGKPHGPPGLVACAKEGATFRLGDYQATRGTQICLTARRRTRWFDDWDFLVTPAVSVAAFPAEKLQPAHWPQHPWDWIMWAEFSYPFNFSGNPAVSIPCGFTSDGLPVGLQIVGKRFDDLGVLQASAAFEAASAMGGSKRPLDKGLRPETQDVLETIDGPVRRSHYRLGCAC